jgi:ABC-2 type transport system permease protein
MKNIWLVLKREYLVRVRKKSFIVMTLLAPLLMAAFYAVIIYVAVSDKDGNKKIIVKDDSQSFESILKNDNGLIFNFTKNTLEAAKDSLKNEKTDLVVYIPADVVEQPKGVKMFAEKNVGLELKSNIENKIEAEIENRRLKNAGIDVKIIESTKANVSASTYMVSDEGEKKSNSYIATGLAGFLAMLIYITVLVYGAQIMRSVMEEKTNRIIEVIISSVKPFHLMMGKILGVGLVGLTQFALWIVFSTVLMTAGGSIVGSKMLDQKKEQIKQIEKIAQQSGANSTDIATAKGEGLSMIDDVLKQLADMNIPLLIICFFFYFLCGYMMYGALFGAIGAAVDSETDTQQFMLPIMLPLIASVSLIQPILADPSGSLAFWASMIPFTSPILMMVRLPFGVPMWELALSMIILVVSFIGVIWLAGRIYRVGILMYGKKTNFKELSKWIFYKS